MAATQTAGAPIITAREPGSPPSASRMQTGPDRRCRRSSARLRLTIFSPPGQASAGREPRARQPPSPSARRRARGQRTPSRQRIAKRLRNLWQPRPTSRVAPATLSHRAISVWWRSASAFPTAAFIPPSYETPSGQPGRCTKAKNPADCSAGPLVPELNLSSADGLDQKLRWMRSRPIREFSLFRIPERSLLEGEMFTYSRAAPNSRPATG